ncbi:MAG: sulfotransferase [Chloroflexi bacterium]|nr:sulfotransferase [Chloroflexota bacterium]
MGEELQRSDNTPPVFITGADRSGNDYLRTLLSLSPSIHLSFESGIFREGWRLSKALPLTDRRSVDRLLDEMITAESATNRNMPLIQAIHDHRQHLRAVILCYQNYGILVREIYGLAFQKPVWGDKIPRIDYAPLLREIWPEARFIMMVRDPRAVAASQRINRGFSPRLAAGYWNTHFNTSVEFQRQFPDQICTVQYEQLVHEPQATLTALLRFVGVPEQQAEAILREKPPNTDSLAKWRQQLSEADVYHVERLTFAGMQKLGYVAEEAKSASGFSGWRYLLSVLWYYRHYLLQPSKLVRERAWYRLAHMLRYSRDAKNE